MINKDERKIYSKVTEAADIMGVKPAYVRNLLNRAMTDDTIKLRGTKIGKEWRIDTQSIYDYLGVNNRNTFYEKDMYIKELEQQIHLYKLQIEHYKNIVSMVANITSTDLN